MDRTEARNEAERNAVSHQSGVLVCKQNISHSQPVGRYLTYAAYSSMPFDAVRCGSVRFSEIEDAIHLAHIGI